MSVIRVAFLGTPEFAKIHLLSLIEDEHFEVVGVVSQPDRPAGRKMKLQESPVKQLAKEKSIPVITPEKVSESLEEIKEWKAEAAVVVAYGQILPKEFLDLFELKIVNVHGSLLPRWRGAAPIQRAVMNGDLETGVALQIMTEKLDAGDVLGVRRMPITETTTSKELYEAMAEKGCELLNVEFMDYLRGNLTPVPQDESQVTYAKKIEKSEGKINWELSARQISCLVRGLNTGPGTFCFLGDKKIKIHECEVSSREGKPGEVLTSEGEDLVVACGEESLRISVLQPESKPRMPVADYLRGSNLKKGDFFK